MLSDLYITPRFHCGTLFSVRLYFNILQRPDVTNDLVHAWSKGPKTEQRCNENFELSSAFCGNVMEVQKRVTDKLPALGIGFQNSVFIIGIIFTL